MISELLACEMDESELIREAMRALGKRKSERKTLACRANAKKPRRKHTSKRLALTVPTNQNHEK